MADEPSTDLDAVMKKVAAQAGGTLHASPRPPADPVRSVALDDSEDENGRRRCVATLAADGSIHVSGSDQGPGVSRFFGPDITSYDYTYVVPADRVGALVRAIGGTREDFALDLLKVYYEAVDGVLSPVMNSPEVAAEFSNWHS